MSTGPRGEMVKSRYTPSNYFDLEPGEKARDPYSFPDKPVCPKCDNKDVVWTPTRLECSKCGTILFDENTSSMRSTIFLLR